MTFSRPIVFSAVVAMSLILVGVLLASLNVISWALALVGVLLLVANLFNAVALKPSNEIPMVSRSTIANSAVRS
ncbi:hypothetical protein [Zooshikella ganghwensis]|uniref:hypothetical protein n=1 Tax=Zooshikella ganghwensis TaxID=202772 RepID=UPI0004015E24|nr:hypothetical protein [Zooshikella ganghwensis]